MHAELFDEMASAGFKLGPGQIGENVTTRGIDLLGLHDQSRTWLQQRVNTGDQVRVELPAGPFKKLKPL